MRHQIEALEPRRLFALPADIFAQASDGYTLTIGTTISATPVTSVAWGVDAPIGGGGQARPFAVILPSAQTVGC